MNTSVIKIDRNNIKDEDFSEACSVLKRGGLVAFPTETVYGLGADALSESAAKKIYAAKGRPSDNPLIVHIADIKALYELASEVPESALKTAEKFWPGPLTMILKKSEKVPDGTTGGLKTVAVRMPSDEIARKLIALSGLYIAAPSANASGRPSTTTAEHCVEDLSGKIEMIIDGGAVMIGIESTIVDLSGDKPEILRPGFITIDDLKTVLPDVVYDPAVLKTKPSDNTVARAPGMKYRHYAPKGELTIFEGEPFAVIDRINSEAKQRTEEGAKVGILATDETRDKYLFGKVISIGRRENEEEIAAHLFAVLRSFDDEGLEYIYSESFSHGRLGQSIMNRLLKAAGYKLLDVK